MEAESCRKEGSFTCMVLFVPEMAGLPAVNAASELTGLTAGLGLYI
jgi:hypothetical protein